MESSRLARPFKVGLGALSIVAVLGVLAACGGGSGEEEAWKDDPQVVQAMKLGDRLPVSWVPEAITFDVNPGARQDVPVTLTSKVALKNARIVFIPDLKNAVTVTPETIPNLDAGQSATIKLTFAPPTSDKRRVIAGVVLLFDKNATVSKPLLVKINLVKPETINGVVVPPEPPADLNNATLTGFDANGNGVRDDVERLIATAHPQSARARAALMQSAAATQRLLVSSGDSQESRLQYLGAATYCSAAAFMAGPDDVTGGARALDASRRLRAQIINTSDRILAFANANAGLGGTFVKAPPFAEAASYCQTALGSLPN
jgi:hypothetical protein